MFKVSCFRGQNELGPTVVPLFGPADSVLEKTAAPSLLPDVVRYIGNLRPENDTQYVLVNAMGASEFFGSNINGDAFPEAALIHRPDEWTGNPLVDSIRARDWPYGFPTFYGAKPFLHHRNKDYAPHNHPSFGKVELASWHDRMKRVELVCRIDRDLCDRFGGQALWDKLKAGMFPDVSMGTKVPYDTCSICLDWDAYRKAQATFDSKRHTSPGAAVLEVHKAKLARTGTGIRGVSITRKDYCRHAATMMNKILPDGRKVFVYNDYPRFFDISFVFVGADKTAKVMLKIADGHRVYSIGSAELAEKLGYDEDSVLIRGVFDAKEEEKTASIPEEELKIAFLGKAAAEKSGEITKRTVPSQFAGKAIPVITRSERDLPKDVLNTLGVSPIEEALSTTAGLGMVLRPREFQRIIMIQIGRRDEADDMEKKNIVFPHREGDKDSIPMSPSFFSPVLARLLLPFMGDRSALGPALEKRVLLSAENSTQEKKGSTSHSSDLLHKIGSAYGNYRRNVMELVANSQELMMSEGVPFDGYLSKFASVEVDELFTPLSVAYLTEAFMDEVGVIEEGVKTSGVERGLPSRNTWATNQRRAGGR